MPLALKTCFLGKAQDEVLNMYVFKNLTEVREITERWITEYNEERPHDSFEDLTPFEYLAKYQQSENSKWM
ncbi:MAG: integrase core domain-containing protein [Pseudomonadales bacterium]|nr:integrase core domain-containing protein [Pseudomonadales bacterium]MDP7596719.1 integrase core domain-containing protein [Pseudomonadales bacterium]HJN51333.1 integrase core domain-containing protein [Pseudomonadales bacterium]